MSALKDTETLKDEGAREEHRFPESSRRKIRWGRTRVQAEGCGSSQGEGLLREEAIRKASQRRGCTAGGRPTGAVQAEGTL